eukprot:9689239-Ditylum_brightwellii.AAC.1
MNSVPYEEIITLTKPPYSYNVALTELRQKWTDEVLTWESDNVPVISLKYDLFHANLLQYVYYALHLGPFLTYTIL